jgi:integrase
VKGSSASSPIRGTKTGKPNRYVPLDERFKGRPLFLNPTTKQRWTYWALRDRWMKACEQATDALRRGVPERSLQAFLGHRDVRSTRRYARLADDALVHVLRTQFVGDLSVARTLAAKRAESQKKLASPTGFEPVLSA